MQRGSTLLVRSGSGGAVLNYAMLPPVPGTWSFEDAWLLTALTRRRRPTLRSVLFAMDMLNADVPNYETFGPAAERLIAAGLAEVRGAGLRQTRRGSALVRRARRGAGGMRSVPPRVLTALSAHRVPTIDRPASVLPSQSDEALRSYISKVE